MNGVKLLRGRALWLLLAAVFLLSYVAPARAQFWNKKDYHHWSASECRKILTNSPWAQNRTSGSSEMPTGAQDTQAAVTAMNGPYLPGRQTLAEIRYTAVFFSALPVREAEVRLGAIHAHYKRMKPAQKKAFDERAARYLAVQYPKYIVIRVNYSTNVGFWQEALNTFWQFQNAAKLKNTAYLVVDGKTVRLARYQTSLPKVQGFFLFFPRLLNNEPLLTRIKKSLTLQITNSTIKFTNAPGQGNVVATPPPAGNVQMEFKVRKMKFHGKIAY